MAQSTESKVEESHFEPTKESQLILTDDDRTLIEKMEKKYSDRLNAITTVYPYVLIRFVIKYAHCADREEETFKRFEAFLVYHDTYEWPTILDEEWLNEDTLFRAWPTYIYGFDHQGHPVVYDEVTSSDLDAVKAAFGNPYGTPDVELTKRFRCRFQKRLANAIRIQSDKLEAVMFTHSMVLDLSGFKTSHFGATYRTFIKEMMNMQEFGCIFVMHTFPETLHRCILINAPGIFRAIWKIVSQFIAGGTKKCSVLGKDYLKELTKIIPLDQIPPKFGGKGTNPIKLGYSADLPHDRYPLNQGPEADINMGSDDDVKEQ